MLVTYVTVLVTYVTMLVTYVTVLVTYVTVLVTYVTTVSVTYVTVLVVTYVTVLVTTYVTVSGWLPMTMTNDYGFVLRSCYIAAAERMRQNTSDYLPATRGRLPSVQSAGQQQSAASWSFAVL
jgi:hypothetical protein